MATLVLQAAGQAVGGLLGPVGGIAGRAAGALAGHIVDQQIFGDDATRTVGRIDDLSIQTASEGNALPKVYGRMRLAGTVIWATDFVEHTSTTGGKGGPSVEAFSYTANFAVAICEGPVARIGRVWADGEPLDLTAITMRTYPGDDEQEPDDLIEAIEGVAPAYRGTAYVVFEHLPVGSFGNRLPQLTFEVIRPVGALEGMVRAVTLIPGASEFGYHPEEVKRVLGPGERATDNRHLGVAPSDIEASLDELQALCPNLERVALVVAWFGDDLRAGECTVRPGVEAGVRETDLAWSVAGLDRASAKLVSSDGEGRPHYGGTPSDNAVRAAITAIKARGLDVVFYPFILMDVPEGNDLADPYGGEAQAPFPWRGRITVHPQPGAPGSPDGTAAADEEIASFVGEADVADFSGAGDVVSYSGPAEWSLRRMILHYAHLAAQVGGVDAFLVGSELRGLTTVRGAEGYPFVDALTVLVDDVRTVLGPATKISYAADWSEYFGHQPGNGDVTFHLDPLWASTNVDFIGIDNYWPLSDWRDGTHLDEALADTPHDRDYLAQNVAGGEGFDWYYASDADRLAQVRSPITDGAHGKPWVFRYKDLASWWSNPHFDRVGGSEVAEPTAWVPQSKPVWFTEVGCPAVDRGANQPNVFYDPKSSESKLPYFSSGRRDDEMQRAYLEAMLSAFDPAFSGAIDDFNPVSGVYAGRMIDPGTVHVWTWDARPWPAFPNRIDVWSDGANWEMGHWLTGRLGGVPLADLLRALFADWSLPMPQVSSVVGVLDGFIVARAQSLRGVLEPLLSATSVVGADTGVSVRFSGLSGSSAVLVTQEDVVDLGADAPLVSETREEAAALPLEQRLRYLDSGREFQVASARYRPAEGSTRQIEEISLPASLGDALATELAETALNARWVRRTSVSFSLPPSALDVTPGDIVTLRVDGRDRDLVVEEIEDLGQRDVRASTLDRAALAPTPRTGSPTPPPTPITLSPPYAFGLNLPLVQERIADTFARVAAFSRPWPGDMGVWSSTDGETFELVRTLTRPSSIGFVASPPSAGPTSRWDYGGEMDVVLLSGELASQTARNVYGGRNAIAVEAADGSWEIIQFRDATLVGERTYRLTTLLRGQVGTEHAAQVGILPGARLAVVGGTVATLRTTNAEIGYPQTLRVGPLSEGIGGRNVTTFDFTPTGRAKVPLSPVHGRARARPADGALEVTWIRRTRIGGDDWPDHGDVPLGESEELYRIEILDGTETVRSADVTSPLYVYSLADQTADFGGAIGSVSMRVAQIAPGFGPGIAYEVTVDVEQP